MTTESAQMEWLTVTEVAEILRVDEDYVRRQCAGKKLTATKIGGRAGYRIHRDALTAFMDGGKKPAARTRTTRRAAK